MTQAFMDRRFNIHYYATNLFGLLTFISIVTLCLPRFIGRLRT